METRGLQSGVNDPRIAQIPDNTDSNSVGGIRIPPPLPYNIPMDSRQYITFLEKLYPRRFKLSDSCGDKN
jgi:hypothetical protein